jgi:hypothetical protein
MMIKKYNEFLIESISFEKWYEDLDILFANSLAYLLDDNYVDYKLDEDDSEHFLMCAVQSSTHEPIEWVKIENDFIPFIELLSIKYNIENNSTIFFDENDNVHYFKVEDIIDGNVNLEKINTILFSVEKNVYKND